MTNKKRFQIINYFIASLSVLGVLFMGYLLNLHYSDHESFCDISAEVSCQVVNQSVYAEILGIPVSILGGLYFLTLILLVFHKAFNKNRYNLIFSFTIFSLVFSLYLSAIEFFELKSICLFCESSKLLMLGILAGSGVGMNKSKEKINVKLIVGALVLGFVFTGVAYLIVNREVIVEDYTDVALCLNENKVTMYGTYWCPSCAKQRKVFGEAVQYLHEVECDPRGEYPQAELCIEKNIAHTPTWIQEKDGEEIKRIQGNYSIKELSDHFGCPHTP